MVSHLDNSYTLSNILVKQVHFNLNIYRFTSPSKMELLTTLPLDGLC
jgi:hypothetical protein